MPRSSTQPVLTPGSGEIRIQTIEDLYRRLERIDKLIGALERYQDAVTQYPLGNLLSGSEKCS